MAKVRRVAVIGAGVSGLTAARTLQDQGFEVTVFEKSSGPGGRTATRRVDPGMTAIAGHLAAGLTLRGKTRIVGLARSGDSWNLTDSAGQTYGPFNHVIMSFPTPQAAELLGDHPLAAEARAVPMTPCWAVLAAFARRIEVAWDGAFVHGSSLAWVARNSSKPGRDLSIDCWILQASSDWSAANLNLGRDGVKAALLEEFAEIAGVPTPPTIHIDAHRWLYSATPLSLERLSLFDSPTGLAVCCDWLAGGRVEGAFRSGVAAANNILKDVGGAFDSFASKPAFGQVN